MKTMTNLNVHRKNGLIAGLLIGLIVFIITMISFKPGLLNLLGMMAWFLISLLCGGGAGFLGGFLVSLIPVRIVSAVSYLVGVVFGLTAGYFQVLFFMMVWFSKNPSSF